jgi:acetyl-CoA carboxylase biotin carboxylase subunit
MTPRPHAMPFDSVLIANRGEIALRIQRACRALELRSICVFSTADQHAPYLRSADVAICIGPAPVAKSYLNTEAILLAAEMTGAQAIHPGYGFLSENAEFAEAVYDSGRVFIGPPAEAIRVMGNKVAAKKAMIAAGVPCVPGSGEALGEDEAETGRIAREIGYPIILKAAGGGGGRGMRVVLCEAELFKAAAVTREEAARFFADPDIYIEKFLEHPRHVEIQVLCDSHGQAVWLSDRDCSLQRRHQKVIEEAPAPGIDRAAIAAIGERCAEACLRIGYIGAGTFEFLYEDGAFYFIEMNTRVQVEHPVTEMVTGIDIVAAQLRIARGEVLGFRQDDIRISGHSLECRINAEDPFTFAPQPGRIEELVLPGGPGVRVDTHVARGYTIPSSYDSMIAKLIVHGATREEALARMRLALSELVIEGPACNAPLHAELLHDPSFIVGGVDIHHLEKLLAKRSIA